MIGKSVAALAAVILFAAAPGPARGASAADAQDCAAPCAAEFSASSKSKKKVKQTTQQHDYMIIRMEEVTVTGRRTPQRAVPQAGILGWPMGLHQNPPSATGTPIAPPPSRGGVIR